MNLSLILGDFEAYYEMRFDRKPKLVRKCLEEAIPKPPKQLNDSKKAPGRSKSIPDSSKESNTPKLPSVAGASPLSNTDEGTDFMVSGSSMSQQSSDKKSVAEQDDIDRVENRYYYISIITIIFVNLYHNLLCYTLTTNQVNNCICMCNDVYVCRLLKPPPYFGLDHEMKQIAAIISRDIYQDSPNVRFVVVLSLIYLYTICAI